MTLTQPEPNPTPSASHTTLPSPDTLALGRTSARRSAEIVAGLRADLMPSPTTRALSTYAGRVVANIILTVAGRNSRPNMNFIPVRTYGFTALARQFLAARPGPHVIVEVAAGFSPRGYELARAMPDATVIEVDLPDVAAEKQKRLLNIDGALPPNLKWFTADLGVVPLPEVLGDVRADLVTAEGLMPYFERPTLLKIVRGVLMIMKPGAMYQADIAWVPGTQEAKQHGILFRQQVGQFLGQVQNQAEAEALLAEGGMVRARVYTPTEITEMFPDLPAPTADAELMAVAYAPDATDAGGHS